MPNTDQLQQLTGDGFLYLATPFFCSLIYVFGRSIQQLNVQHSKYLLVPPTSLAMAFVEVALVYRMAHCESYWIAVPIAAGSAIGCCVAMLIHSKIRGKSC